MSLRITRNGLLDTIQDGGRYGCQQLGINPGGVMDRTAMCLANMLMGNEPGEPVIEMHFPAAEILFEETVLMALSGADFSATIDRIGIPILHPILVKKGAVLQFGKIRTGARIYLALQGGLVSDTWLNSCSTHLQVKAGGFEGRALKKNDRVLLKQKSDYVFIDPGTSFAVFPWQANISGLYASDKLRFIPGREYNLLNDISRQHLEKNSFAISNESNRMGYRLQGNALALQTPHELISTGVTFGTIQLLPDGQLIILMADHQTAGGYPRIGHVISADISSLAQMRAGENFCLQQVNIAEAENLLADQERNLQQLQNACTFRLDEYDRP